MNIMFEFPELDKELIRSFKRFIDESFRIFSREYGDSIELVFRPLLFVINQVESILTLTPWPLVMMLLLGMTYKLTKNIKLCIATLLYLTFVGLFGLWSATMYTLSLVIVSTTLSILVGIPTGVLMAKSNKARNTITPVLDIMQTIPIFIYLIPIVMLLGLGKIPGIIAMVIYSIPPIIRLTNLGIRQVEIGMIEAALSMGMTALQTLHRIEIPLAKKSIMTGVNQTVMNALAMVVIASMIGVQGLGTHVLQAVQNQYIGAGVIAGSAIVGLAIIIDRILQNIK